MVDVRRSQGQRMSDKTVIDALTTVNSRINPNAKQPGIATSEATPPYPPQERVQDDTRQYEMFARHAFAAAAVGDGRGDGPALAAGASCYFTAQFEPTFWRVRCINNGTNGMVVNTGQSTTFPALIWDKDTYTEIPGAGLHLAITALATNGAALSLQAIAVSGVATNTVKVVENARYGDGH